MKDSLIDFSKVLGVKGWLWIVFLLLTLAATIWLAVVGSIDLARGLSSERSVGLSTALAMAGTMMATSVIVDRSSYQSKRGRLHAVMAGTLVFLLGVVLGIRLNSLPRTLISGAGAGLAFSLVLLLSQLYRKVRK